MKKTIKDYDLYGKRIIIRVDFNVPMQEGIIQDDTRIIASLKTIRYAISKGAKVILLSHLGKVKEASDLIKNNLFPVSIRLSQLLEKEVFFSKETRGKELEQMVSSLKNGEVLLIQNTRYEDLEGKKESTCDPELSSYWASLGDLFINDAYGTSHRSHASNVGIAKHLPNGIGFLIEEEINKLDAIMNSNSHPFIVIMGGAKVHDKIKIIKNLIDRCDALLIGGGMAYTFLKAQGKPIGKSLLDEESLDFCLELLNQYPDKIILPRDHLVASSNDPENITTKIITETTEEEIGFDIGPRTIELFCQKLANAKRVIMNGPMGYFENEFFQTGTKEIYQFLATHQIKTFIGGGDTAASASKLADKRQFYHISTGGGATLEYLGGNILPGLSVIDEKEKI